MGNKKTSPTQTCKYCRRQLREITLGFAAIGSATFQKPHPATVCDYCDKTSEQLVARKAFP